MTILPTSRYPCFSNYSKNEKGFLAFLAISCVVYIALSYYVRIIHRPLWRTQFSSSMTVLLLSSTTGFMLYKWKAKKTEKVVLASLNMTTQSDQKDSLLLTKIPDDVLCIILQNLEIKEVGRLSLVCKRCYKITHTPEPWKPVLNRLFPDKTFNLSNGPFPLVSDIVTEIKKIKENFSDRTLEVLGGPEKIYLLPKTDLMQDLVCSYEDFRDYFWRHNNQISKIEIAKKLSYAFGKHSIVRGIDRHGKLCVLVHVRRVDIHNNVTFHMLMIGGTETNARGEKITYWWDDIIVLVQDVLNRNRFFAPLYCDKENTQNLSWWRNFFAGTECSVEDLYRANGKTDPRPCGYTIQTSTYSKI